jgi:hypothetical protein
MSTKTTFKRIALVTVAALSFGLLTSVTPASAVASTALGVAVGPNGATSLTVVGGTESTTGALVRLDVTSDSTTTLFGLQDLETITASVIAGPTGFVAGSLADTATASGRTGFSALSMQEVKGQTTVGVPGTAAATTSGSTDWTKIGTLASVTNIDSTGAKSYDSALGGYLANTYFKNMDGRAETTATNNTVSYYVSIHPRTGGTVIDSGAYTVQFQLTDALGAVRGTKTVKIDFVSTAAKSGSTLAVATSGNFLIGAALTTTDTASATYATVTLRNRDGGLVRTETGDAPIISVKMQTSITGALVYADTNTAGTTRLNVSDTGTYGIDFGQSTLGSGTPKDFFLR